MVLLLQGDLDKATEEEEPEVKVPKLDVPDLRQILKRQDEPRATGLFSAAEFIAPDDDANGLQEADVAANEGSAMETEKAMNGTADHEDPLTADIGED